MSLGLGGARGWAPRLAGRGSVPWTGGRLSKVRGAQAPQEATGCLQGDGQGDAGRAVQSSEGQQG